MDLTLAGFVYCLTCFFSFGVQALFYAWYRLREHPLIDEHKHVFRYTSGIIGDGLLVPAINIFAVLTLVRIQPDYFNPVIIFSSLIGGKIITFLFHWGQQRYQQMNWTMPEVGRWNLLGTYHALFMFFESSFLCFTFIHFLIFIFYNGLYSFSQLPIKYSFVVLFIFGVTFVYDYWVSLFRDKFKALSFLNNNSNI